MSTSKLVVGFLVAVWGVCSFAGEKSLRRQIQALIDSKKYEEAVELVSSSLDRLKGEDLLFALSQRAVAYQRLGKLKESAQASEEVARRLPKHPMAPAFLRQSADLYGRTRDYESRERTLRVLISLYPDSTYYAGAALALGYHYWRRGVRDRAVTVWNELIEKRPESPEALTAMREVATYYFETDRQKALALFEKGASSNIKKYGDEPINHLRRLGYLYRSAREWRKAGEVFERASSIDPSRLVCQDAMLWAGRCYDFAGLKEKAVKLLRKLIALEPKAAWNLVRDARVTLARIYTSQGKYKEGLQELDDGITWARKQKRTDAESSYIFAKAEYLQRNIGQGKASLDEVLKIYRALIARFPTSGLARQAYCRLSSLLRHSDSEGALAVINEALKTELSSRDADTRCRYLFQKADILIGMREVDKAIAVCKELLQHALEHKKERWYREGARRLAQLLRRSGRSEEAIQTYQTALRSLTNPREIDELKYWFGFLCRDLRQTQRALELWDEVMVSRSATRDLVERVLRQAIQLAKRGGQFRRTAGYYEFLFREMPDSRLAEEIRTRRRQAPGEAFEKAGNFRKAYHWYKELGLDESAKLLEEKLNRIILCSLELEDGIVEEPLVLRLLLSNSYPLAMDATAHCSIFTDDGKLIRRYTIGPVRLAGASTTYREVRHPFTGAGFYRVEARLGEQTLQGRFYVGHRRPIKLSLSAGDSTRIPARRAERLSGSIYQREGGLFCKPQAELITTGNTISFTLVTDARLGIVARAVPATGVSRLFIDGERKQYFSLQPGEHALSVELKPGGFLEGIELECWESERGGLRLAGRSLLLEAESLKCLGNLSARKDRKASGGKLLTAGQGGGQLLLLLNSPSEALYYPELVGTLNCQLGLQTVEYLFEVRGKLDMYPQGWNRGYKPLYLILKGNGELYRLLYTRPLSLNRGANLIRLKVPGGESLDYIVLRPAIPDLEASLQFLDPYRIYFKKESPQIKLSLKRREGQLSRLKATLHYQLLRLADRVGRGPWEPDVRVVQKELVGTVGFDLRGSDDSFEARLEPPRRKYGLIGITLECEDGESKWLSHLGSVAIVPDVKIGEFKPDGPFIASFGPGRDDPLLESYKRMGIDWIRTEVGWVAFERQKGRWDFSRVDPTYELCQKYGVLVVNLASHAPEWAKPHGEFKEIPYKNYTITVDNCPAREHIEDWQRAWEVFLKRYPRVVRSLNLWNEPWEGGGISGWKSTGAHYRLLLKYLKFARDRVDPTVTIVAADSAHNTDWKIFAANMQDYIDVISTHYESPKSCMAYAMARYYGKEVWETETWLAWQGDSATVRRALYQFVLGARKVSLWTTEMLFDGYKNPTPAVAWTAGLHHLLDGVRFEKFIHPERPPFVCLFSGKDRKVAAILTCFAVDLSQVSGEFRSQFASKKPFRMLIDDPTGQYEVYDVLANPITNRQGTKIELKVGLEPVFVVAKGDGLRNFEQALAQAQLIGLRPAELEVFDLTEPLSAKPALRILLRNALPKPLNGTVVVRAGNLKLAQREIRVSGIPPGGERLLSFEVVGGRTRGDNRNPITVTLNSPEGTASIDDIVAVATIARKSITVDGDLSEWYMPGVQPVYLSRGESIDTSTLRAWYPWKELARLAPQFFARVAFAWDNQNLYFMAEVRDPTEQRCPAMLSGKQLHEFQLPPAEHVYVKMGPMPACKGDSFLLSLDNIERKAEDWIRKYELFPPGHPLYRLTTFISTRYQYVIYPTEEGGTDVFRIRTPEFYWLHPLPMDYAWCSANCNVREAKAIAKRHRSGDSWIYEVAIPWSELKTIEPRPGKRIRLSFMIADNSVFNSLAWSENRTCAVKNTLDFTPVWGEEWSATTEWGFLGD